MRELANGLVLMAVYRPDPTLFERQVRSLQRQSVTSWRCIVGIDGKDPETTALAGTLVVGDDRFEVIEYSDNLGVYRHVERLCADAGSEVDWIALSDQDDVWYPDKFERLLPALTADGVTAVSGQARLVRPDGTVLGRTHRREGGLTDLLLRNQVSGSMAIFVPKVLERALPFPPSTVIAIHDHWLVVVAAALGRVDITRDVVQDYVQHGGNVLGEAPRPSLRASWRRVRAGGGIVTAVDHVVVHRWGWRVSMARAIRPLTDSPMVAEVSASHLGKHLCRELARGVWTRRLSPRGGAVLAAACFLWAHALREQGEHELTAGRGR